MVPAVAAVVPKQADCLMHADIAIRPGLVNGRYPERSDDSGHALENYLQRLLEGLRKPASRRQWDRLLTAIRVQHNRLAGASEARFANNIANVRQRLLVEGFSEAAVAQSFALVRESAARMLGIRHYDSQLIGGWVMLRGMLAEMETGEGKTLTATLSAATAALVGIPVHIVTVNDYLAARDAEWMGPVFRQLGLTVGVITHQHSAEQRQHAYGSDIVYCSNKELVFDYLKDRLVLGRQGRGLQVDLERLHSDSPRSDSLLMRGLCFAIVDEADSVLIDEARTPLIIAAPGDTREQFKTYRMALWLADQLRAGRDFQVNASQRSVQLSDRGRARLAQLSEPLGGVWLAEQRREHLLTQALIAGQLFKRDMHYLVRDDRVEIIDQNTGRVLPGRAWELGLQQMIEVKESCTLTASNEPLARISYQQFFRRYLRLAGMTGTAREVSKELHQVYGLRVVPIPTQKPSRRVSYPTRTFSTQTQKMKNLIYRISELHKQGRPVLAATRTLADSEQLSARLNEAGLLHQVLNARQDRDEARIVALAGEAGCITVATNMAGRGTDIKLGAGVAENGGLAVLIYEHNMERRIDRQLAGRAARQGDPGSVEVFVSLEDELLQRWPQLSVWIGSLCPASGKILGLASSALIRLAQRAAERRAGGIRRLLLRNERQQARLLAYSGELE